MSDTTGDGNSEVAGPPTAIMQAWLSWFLLAFVIALGLLVTFGIGQQVDRRILKALAFRQNVTSEALIVAAQWITWGGAAAQRSIAMVVFACWLL